ncbi:TraG family conjugative transposon ATPase [Pontibacter mangrovi]|uniref:TraG family conjugative transposon ATPase n=1 Tax=Pontibacter mangrovi TaxID=2589816 RepID=A0A501VPP9_9BACT|nr:TraG family conjugative transposon ATPase [Pontibacter mangrovi]TPE39713.1 TraG family conjugative transposon ATPase [Pontibacter mangrovi]
MKKRAFRLPYAGIGQDTYTILYHESGAYAVLLRLVNPVLQYCADPEAYARFHQALHSLVQVLGPGYTLQKTDILSRRHYQPAAREDFLSQRFEAHFAGRPYRAGSTYLTITRDVQRSGFFAYEAGDFEVFLRNIGKALDLLQAQDFQPQPLEEGEVRALLQRLLAFDFSGQPYALSNFQVSAEGLAAGERAIRCLSLVDVDAVSLPATLLPTARLSRGEELPVDLLHFLSQVPDCESLVYNQVIQVPDQRQELTRLQAKRKKHLSMPDPANEQSVQDIDQVLVAVARDSQLLVYGHYSVLLSAAGPALDRAVNFLESALFSVGILPSRNAYNQLELFRCALPGNSPELREYDKFLTTAEAALCLLYKERLLDSEPSTFQVRFTDRQGIPLSIDTSDAPVFSGRMNNRNKFVLGPSGAGKSFFMNHLIRQYALQGTDVILVDTGHSYAGLCAYLQGRYITYTEDRPITMNPFRLSAEEFNEEKREFLKSLVALLWKGAGGTLSQVEDSVLSSVIAAYYRDFFDGERPPSYLSFQSFYDFSLTQIEQITRREAIAFDLRGYRFILKKFCLGGEYGQILNNELDQALFEEPFIVFEIDAIKEHKILFPITTLIIMDVFLQKMRHRQRRKALVIEEAWKAIASPLMAGYILYVYKTVRKFWGEAVVVTQELDDIIGNAVVKHAIISNSDTVCLLDQTKFRDNFSQIAALLSLSEVECRKIFTINNLDNKAGRGRFKEVYIRRGATGEVYGVEVSLEEYLTFTTERREKEALQGYQARYGDFQQALEAFVADFRASGLTLPAFVQQLTQDSHETLPVRP